MISGQDIFHFSSHKLSITFVLHAIFSPDKRLQEFFFQNHPPPHPSRVKWSAYKVTRPSIFVGTPSILESLIPKQIDLYCKKKL